MSDRSAEDKVMQDELAQLSPRMRRYIEKAQALGKRFEAENDGQRADYNPVLEFTPIRH